MMQYESDEQITKILSEIHVGVPGAAEQLLPIENRKLDLLSTLRVYGLVGSSLPLLTQGATCCRSYAAKTANAVKEAAVGVSPMALTLDPGQRSSSFPSPA